jgi:hypothetical protein
MQRGGRIPVKAFPYLPPELWAACNVIPFWRTRQRFAPRMKRIRELEEQRAAHKTPRVLVLRKPCTGRLAMNCEHGPGCPGHSVRVLVVRNPPPAEK